MSCMRRGHADCEVMPQGAHVKVLAQGSSLVVDIVVTSETARSHFHEVGMESCEFF
jgi:hypothetical protein